jgi:hypothetical protein
MQFPRTTIIPAILAVAALLAGVIAPTSGATSLRAPASPALVAHASSMTRAQAKALMVKHASTVAAEFSSVDASIMFDFMATRPGSGPGSLSCLGTLALEALASDPTFAAAADAMATQWYTDVTDVATIVEQMAVSLVFDAITASFPGPEELAFVVDEILDGTASFSIRTEVENYVASLIEKGVASLTNASSVGGYLRELAADISFGIVGNWGSSVFITLFSDQLSLTAPEQKLLAYCGDSYM